MYMLIPSHCSPKEVPIDDFLAQLGLSHFNILSLGFQIKTNYHYYHFHIINVKVCNAQYYPEDENKQNR